MIRALGLTALATLALGAVSVTAQTIAPGLNLGQAEAADFTGRIKRIRIRKRRVGEGFKMSAQTAGNGSADTEIASAKAVLTDSDGKTIETVTLGTAFHGTVVATTTVVEADIGDKFTITLDGDDLDGHELVVPVKKGKGSAADGEGWKVQANINPTGTLRVLIKNEDRVWDGSALTGVSVTGEDGVTLDLDLKGSDQRLQATLTKDMDLYSTVTATVTVYDADGVKIESASQDFEFDGTGVVEEEPLEAIDLDLTEKGFSVTTWTLDDGTDLALEVDLFDADTDKSALMTVDDTPVLSQHSYVVGPIAFKSSPAGSKYTVTATGLVVGGVPQWSLKTSIVVPTYVSGDHTYNYTLFEDETGVLGLVQDEGGVYAHVIYFGEKPVESVLLSMATDGGPSPTDGDLEKVEMELAASWNMWVQAAETTLPKNWDLELAVTSADGTEVETHTATGSGDGSVFAKPRRKLGRGTFPKSLVKKAEGLAGR